MTRFPRYAGVLPGSFKNLPDWTGARRSRGRET